jgi:hypothetical protein
MNAIRVSGRRDQERDGHRAQQCTLPNAFVVKPDSGRDASPVSSWIPGVCLIARFPRFPFTLPSGIGNTRWIKSPRWSIATPGSESADRHGALESTRLIHPTVTLARPDPVRPCVSRVSTKISTLPICPVPQPIPSVTGKVCAERALASAVPI